MAKVLQEKNLVLLWTDDSLFFEWKIYATEATESFPDGLWFQSLNFKLDGKTESYLEFDWKNGGTSSFYLIHADSLRPKNGKIVISDNKTVICDLSKDELFSLYEDDCINVEVKSPPVKNFPLTFFGIFIDPSYTPYPKKSNCMKKLITAVESNSAGAAQTTAVSELSVDFKKLFDSPVYSDIALKVEDVLIKAHKIVLHARSPVFQKMLSHDTTEASENTIAISDISAPVMKQLVAYLYTGEKEECSFEECCELYYAADKYEVMSLREACKEELLTHLQVDNACMLFSLANLHSDEVFVEEVVQFINANFECVVETESFDDLDKDEMKFLTKSYTRSKTKC